MTKKELRRNFELACQEAKDLELALEGANMRKAELRKALEKKGVTL